MRSVRPSIILLAVWIAIVLLLIYSQAGCAPRPRDQLSVSEGRSAWTVIYAAVVFPLLEATVTWGLDAIRPAPAFEGAEAQSWGEAEVAEPRKER